MNTVKEIAFDDVEVVASTKHVLLCRVGHGEICGISRGRLLPGSEILQTGDHGRLVLSLDVAEALGLVPSTVGDLLWIATRLAGKSTSEAGVPGIGSRVRRG